MADAACGRRIASWPSLKTDLRNAGAEWVDQEVVVDGNQVSSRKPDDIPAFNRQGVRGPGGETARWLDPATGAAYAVLDELVRERRGR